MIERTITKKYKYTESELAELRTEIIDLMSSLQEKKGMLAELKAQFTGEIKTLEEKIASVHHRIVTGHYNKEHRCEKRFDEENHQIVYIDVDSGELIDSEKAPPDLFVESPDDLPIEEGDTVMVEEEREEAVVEEEGDEKANK